MRVLIDIKQIDISKLNDVKIYDELPLEVEGQVAYCQGKLYYGDGSEWKEISVGGSALPEGTINQTLRHNGTEWTVNSLLESLDGDDGFTYGLNMGVTEEGFGYNYNPVYSIKYEFLHVPTGAMTIDNTIVDRESISIGKGITYSDSSGVLSTTRITNDEFSIDKYNSELGYNESVKINTNEITHCSLVGDTSSLLETTLDGTIQRSTAIIPAAQVNSDWNATEGVAQILNKPEMPSGESVNIETLTADKTLTASDATVQIYTSDANRVVNLPTTGVGQGHKFIIKNNYPWDSDKYILVRTLNSDGGTNKLYSGNYTILYRYGTGWISIPDRSNVALGGNANASDAGIAIGGNSNGRSLSVAVGDGANGSNGGIAIGKDSIANGIAIGKSSNSQYYSISIGSSAKGAVYGISIGNSADSKGDYGVAIGDNAIAQMRCVSIGSLAGKGETSNDRLYIHNSSVTVGKNSLIYGEFTNRIVRINNTLYVNDLVGTGDRPIVADPTGKLKIGTTTTLPSRTEYLSENLSGTEHTFTGTTLGITGDLRSRIKNIKCFAVDSNGDYNGALIANEFIYETDVTVNTTTNLSGSFRIKLLIEYV